MQELPAPKAPRAQRVLSMDLLRGWVMVLMALDHARDFFGDPRVSPETVGVEQPLLFLTRWVTHFCAPSFVFLAGVAAFLHGARPGKTRTSQTRFLVTRGLWLLVLEATVISAGWLGTYASAFMVFQVIGAIGVAMIALALMLWLPRSVQVAATLAILFGHNLLDGWTAQDFGAWSGPWTLLHEGSRRGPLVLVGHLVWVQYAVLPWIGIMALGYITGPIFEAPRESRRRGLFALGLLGSTLFVLLRWSAIYGDENAWETQASALGTLIDFVNVTKYPPSLLFTLMTLGPALLFLAAFDGGPSKTSGWLASKLIVFGRVPLFYYVVHLFVIQFSAGLLAWFRDGQYVGTFETLFRSFTPGSPPLPPNFGNGNDLLTVYFAWFAVIVALYPLCRWYGERKRAGTSWLWSYL